MSNKTAFLLHKDYMDAMEELPAEDFKTLIMAMFNYSISKTVVDLPAHLLLAFKFVKSRLDFDSEKWEETKTARSEAGKKGAESRWTNKNDETMANDGKNGKAILPIANDGKNGKAILPIANDGKNGCNMLSVSVSDNDIYPPPIPPQGDSDAGGDIRSGITDYEPDETDSDFAKPEYVAAPSLPPKPKQQPKQRSSDEMFSVFWDAYPKKISKKDALKAFRVLKVTDALFACILDGLEKHKASYQWLKNGGEYIPHPATFLRQERWKDFDEISDSANISQQSSGGSYQRSSPLKVRNKKSSAEPFSDPELEARLLARGAKQEQQMQQ